jgi:biopolymer transport protein ExbD
MQYKMTLQADKDIDFLSIKKVLYTLTEAGVQEINFAVIKVKPEDKYGIL